MANKKIPNRQCIGCRDLKEKKDLIRIVKTKENEILIDRTGKANGRGAYICDNMDCFQKAVKSRGIERSLRMPVSPDVYEELERQMTNKNE